LEFDKEYEVIFVSTPMELLVNTVNEVKQVLKRPVSDYPDIFRDKYLQRELIFQYNPEL
jgi:phenylalanyl-tRNA synthetase beta subunit